MNRLKIKTDHSDNRIASVILNDEEIGCKVSGLTLQMRGGEIPKALIEVPLSEVEIEGDFEELKENTENEKANNITINKIYNRINKILHYQLESINGDIREKMTNNCHGSENINFTGSVVADTISMWEYARKTKDIYDKAYVMKSVLDNVLETYFNALKEIESNK